LARTFLARRCSNRLSETKQNWVHRLVDELQEESEAEVDLNLEQLEEEEFDLPSLEEMAPFTLDVSDEEDGDELSTENAGGRL
jgi:hypothetical protein